MFTFLSIFLLQLAYTYKIIFIPKINKLYTHKNNEIIIDNNSSLHSFENNMTTNAQIKSFIENIKKKETTQHYINEVWDDGEVEW